eukprot:SM000332S12451  [mRNA]  locus=s332:82180:83020:- [translate_table: standard]
MGDRGQSKYGQEAQKLAEKEVEGGWKVRDVVFLLFTLGTIATIATVVIGGTVIGGGGFLLLIRQAIGICVPLTIATVVIGGGALALVLGGATFIGFLAWLWNWWTGEKPPGAEQLEKGINRSKQQLSGH